MGVTEKRELREILRESGAQLLSCQDFGLGVSVGKAEAGVAVFAIVSSA